MKKKYSRVESLDDETVIYTNNETGELLFKQTVEGKTQFKKDDGKIEITHTLENGSTIKRKRNYDGTMYFLDENGKPMERWVDDETGKVKFRDAESG